MTRWNGKDWNADTVFGILVSRVPWVLTLEEERHLAGYQASRARALVTVQTPHGTATFRRGSIRYTDGI